MLQIFKNNWQRQIRRVTWRNLLAALFAGITAISLTGCAWARGGGQDGDPKIDREHMHEYDHDRDQPGEHDDHRQF